MIASPLSSKRFSFIWKKRARTHYIKIAEHTKTSLEKSNHDRNRDASR